MGKEKRKRVEGEDKSPDTENKKRKEDKKHEKNQKTGALEIMGEDKPHVRPKGDSAKSEGIEDKSKGTLDNSQNHMEENRQLSASTDKDQAKLAKKARKLAHRAERQGKAAEVDPKSKAFAYLKVSSSSSCRLASNLTTLHVCHVSLVFAGKRRSECRCDTCTGGKTPVPSGPKRPRRDSFRSL